MWPFSKSRKPKKIDVPQVKFIGEQDGPPERKLKTALGALFKDEAQILKAYLAIAEYTDGAVNVALCLRTTAEPDEKIVHRVSEVFGALFNGKVHLDIMFLSPVQEDALGKVCNPFYICPE